MQLPGLLLSPEEPDLRDLRAGLSCLWEIKITFNGTLLIVFPKRTEFSSLHSDISQLSIHICGLSMN